MGLADRAKSKLEELSHGNQQRVQLATALVHDPELLVLDEPFSGLDPIGIATMTEVIRERAAAGVGVVFSSHQLDLVEDVCEDVVIIARGRIVASGAIDELKAASGRQHLEVEVVGSDGTWLDGRDRPDGPRAHRRQGQAAGRPRRSTSTACSRRPARPARSGRFAYQPPKLSELFMEAVARIDGRTTEVARCPAGGASGSSPAGRSSSAAAAADSSSASLFTTLIVVGSFVLTGDPRSAATTQVKVGVVEPAPAGLETTLQAASRRASTRRSRS